MARAYSLDLRERVVAAIEEGLSTHQAAARFSIGVSTAGTWARLKRSQGDVRPGRQGKPKGSVLDVHADFILGVLEDKPGHDSPTSWSTGLLPSALSGSSGRQSGSFSTGAT